ncbi:MAG TPA: response regulator [Bdellovibrionota bacterium]|nr:response regulator [Bdellovibrionota bacterium]
MICKSILIAEDNDDIRETLEEVLKMEGYRVHAVKNGREALRALKQIEGPALILLDLMMPVMNGWEVLEAQRENNVIRPLPVVVVSAISAAMALKHKEKLVSAAGYLSKPVSLDSLLEIVRQHCGTGSDRLGFRALQSSVADASDRTADSA